MATAGNKRRGMLGLGLLLVAAGLIFVLVPARAGVAEWLIRLWPIFLICAGVVRVMGFAVERKPKSPTGGMLLIIIGVLFFISRFHSNLNALEIYGRYWPVLLAIFAAVELVRFYSHRPGEGAPPRIFTIWRFVVILLIVISGVLANRVAVTNPSLLSALKLPGMLDGLRDSVVGETYTFTDKPFVAEALRPGTKVVISNSYGNVKIVGGASRLRATLSKGVRSWNEGDAKKIAQQIQLVVTPTAEGVAITTNRQQINQQFTTNIQLEVPTAVALDITNSYGTVSTSSTTGRLDVKASYGRAEASGIVGDASFGLTHSDVEVANIDGDLSVTGAKGAKVSNVSGSVDIYASNGVVELRNIAGEIKVDAPFSEISAHGLGSDAELKTEHGSIAIDDAVGVSLNAPHSQVRVEDVNGDLHITSSHGDLSLRRIKGELVVESERAEVDAEELEGPASILTSHGDVKIKNFHDSLRVQTSYRDVVLVSSEEPSGDIVVENDHGEIRLLMPQSSQFQIDASSRSGLVKSVGFVELTHKDRESLYAILGDEGPVIRLRTSYKNITLQASNNRPAQAGRPGD
ncbi:MAG TPA: DUF4097 family beta strand repeat-containing protein [Blastocatellia bacterium]|jgi:uncharacterized membrane protein HdeD (DUF308 family)|nr:DUF4097 family beta strand repeat-containing protein [Blastocatellia bacterium]